MGGIKEFHFDFRVHINEGGEEAMGHNSKIQYSWKSLRDEGSDSEGATGTNERNLRHKYEKRGTVHLSVVLHSADVDLRLTPINDSRQQ